MRPDTVSRRYARALFQLAEEQGEIDVVAKGLAAATAIAENPDVAKVLHGPLDAKRKRGFVESIAAEIGASDPFKSFLLLLTDHGRLSHLGSIRSVFDALVDERRGILRAHVRSATTLPDDVLAELSRVFGAMTGKQVVAEVRVDPSLIAGVVVEIEGKVYDGSLQTQLRKLEQHMATGS